MVPFSKPQRRGDISYSKDGGYVGNPDQGVMGEETKTIHLLTPLSRYCGVQGQGLIKTLVVVHLRNRSDELNREQTRGGEVRIHLGTTGGCKLMRPFIETSVGDGNHDVLTGAILLGDSPQRSTYITFSSYEVYYPGGRPGQRPYMVLQSLGFSLFIARSGNGARIIVTSRYIEDEVQERRLI